MTTTAQPRPTRPDIADLLHAHVDAHADAVDAPRAQTPVLTRWGRELADRLLRGQRLLVAGNGGSAAEAPHLTAEIVGRFDGERRPFSAISLHAESSSLTAIGNDDGFAEVFARQVQAHGRPGDVLMLFSSSGRSENLLRAAAAASRAEARTWALTGREPNPLAEMSDEQIALAGPSAVVQEAHLLALHLLCRVFDDRVRGAAPGGGAPGDGDRVVGGEERRETPFAPAGTADHSRTPAAARAAGPPVSATHVKETSL